MSETTYHSTGDLIDYTPGSATAAGAVVFQGLLCGQLVTAVEANQKGALRVAGVVRVAKLTGVVFAAGDPVHWDSANARASATAVDGLMGVAVGGGANGELHVDVRLNSAALSSAGILPAAQQALSGAGAISVATYVTKWTTTAADAGTLADGTYAGQLKKIQLVVDGGDGTLTPANLAGGTTITFADAGDFALLMWSGSEWVPVELGNDADGVTAPVLA